LTTIDAMLQPAPASAATAPQPWRYRDLPDVPLELKTNGCLPAAFLCTAMREHLTRMKMWSEFEEVAEEVYDDATHKELAWEYRLEKASQDPVFAWEFPWYAFHVTDCQGCEDPEATLAADLASNPQHAAATKAFDDFVASLPQPSFPEGCQKLQHVTTEWMQQNTPNLSIADSLHEQSGNLYIGEPGPLSLTLRHYPRCAVLRLENEYEYSYIGEVLEYEYVPPGDGESPAEKKLRSDRNRWMEMSALKELDVSSTWTLLSTAALTLQIRFMGSS